MTTGPDRDTAATLTEAVEARLEAMSAAAPGYYDDVIGVLREERDRLATQPPQDDQAREAFAYTVDLATGEFGTTPVPPQDDPQPDEREAELHGPGWFWTRAEWAEWSNGLATLFTEDEAHGNPDGAQESVILDTFTAWAEERRRDPDTGLRERVAETVRVCAINGAPTWVVDAVQDALAEPTPGVES